VSQTSPAPLVVGRCGVGTEFAVGVVPGGVTGTDTAGVADGVLRWVGVAVPLD